MEKLPENLLEELFKKLKEELLTEFLGELSMELLNEFPEKHFGTISTELPDGFSEEFLKELLNVYNLNLRRLHYNKKLELFKELQRRFLLVIFF